MHSFGQGLSEGGAVMVLNELLIWHGVVTCRVLDRNGRDNSCGVVVVLVFVAGDLEQHAQRVRIWGVCVAVAVEVSV